MINQEQASKRRKTTRLRTVNSEHVSLVGQLIDVEMDGQEVVAEFGRLEDALKKQIDSNVLGHIREQFLEKLSVFEASSRTLRQCLQQQHHSESSLARVTEQLDMLRKKVADMEKDHSDLQAHLDELAPLPDQLRRTEIQLRERTEELEITKKLLSEYGCQIKGLRLKGQHDLEDQRRIMCLEVADMKEALKQMNLQVQDLTRENNDMKRQLKAATVKEIKMLDVEKESQAKDRAYRTQILDLQAQINQGRHEFAQLKRERDESERNYRSQLVNVQRKQDQCESAKRCLQNCIQVIQTSYSSTFGDPITTSPSDCTVSLSSGTLSSLP